MQRLLALLHVESVETDGAIEFGSGRSRLQTFLENGLRSIAFLQNRPKALMYLAFCSGVSHMRGVKSGYGGELRVGHGREAQ